MPAAVRGAGRSTAKARSKSSASPLKARAGKAAPGQGTRAGFHLSPKLVLGLTGLAIGGALIVAGAVDHRAQKAVASLGDDLVQQSAALGFKLANVKLEGASARSSADILRAAALRPGAPLFAVDLEAARNRIQQVGWVKAVRVVRLAPDTVLISVDERKLLAVWQDNGHAQVIDASGVAAPEADPARFPSLPLVVGDGANTAAAAILPLVATRPRLAARLDALVRVDGRRWDLRLKDGTIVQLPASDEEAALIRLDQLDQQSRILDLGFQRIDLRDPQMVMVRPRQPQAPAATAVSDGAG